MSGLQQLQDDFQAYLLADTTADDVSTSAFKHRIIDDVKVGAEKRLDIYAQAYRLRLIEALTTTYPKLFLLLGDDLFDSTARSYIKNYPSSYRNMRWYGDKMQQHLMEVLAEYPVAAELAAFEWALSLAFDAADAQVLTIEHLAEIDAASWGQLSFKFQPSLNILELHCNAVGVWQALNQEQAPPAFECFSSPALWAIWRVDYDPHFRSMDALEASVLALALLGASFGDMCLHISSQVNAAESAVDTAIAPAMLAAQYLSSWLNDAMISEFRHR